VAVTVRLFAAARAAVGSGEVIVEAGTLAEVLDRIEEIAPDFAKVRPACSFLLDEVAVHGDPALVNVSEGQLVDVLPPFAGG
jgi:sulfur-carrier protein